MKTELLAPAGDLEKVKIALLYGADAVYIGGTKFSLRARASKFSLEKIEEAVIFAHSINKKIYVTTNIIPHNEDLTDLDDYLITLDKIGVDAIICSSPIIIDRAKATTNLEIHLSTQMSVTNSVITNFWHDYGVSRVVLARELSLKEIAEVQIHSKADLEVFIHGGMCVSYSGRCTLSNYMSDRDANRGGCAHSCRWKYDLYHQFDLLSNDFDFQMSSKDLETLAYVPKLLDLGIASLKIEGRMKSIHYIATVVSTYRMLIDDYESKKLKNISFYESEIQKAENRLTSFGFMEGITTVKQQLYNMRSEEPTKEFVGIVLEYNSKNKTARIEQRNYFLPNDTLEVLSPNKIPVRFQVSEIFTEDGISLDAARHPLQIIYFQTDIELFPNDLIRKVF